MSTTVRPYAAAGIALMSASLVAAGPVATAPAHLTQVRDIQLTADGDFSPSTDIGIVTDGFKDLTTNLSNLSTGIQDAFAGLKDAISGNDDWYSALTNPQELFGALTFLAGDQKGFLDPLASFTLGLPIVPPDAGLGDPGTSLGGWLLYAILTNQGAAVPGLGDLFPTIADPIPTIAQILSSPLSGVLLGAVSPLVAPIVPFLNPFLDLAASLQGDDASPDFIHFLSELADAPLRSVTGLFNGDTLHLDALVPLVSQAGLLPDGVEITSLSYAFGGLLSPGEVGGNLAALTAPELPDPIFGGGSMLNALGLTLGITDPITLDIPVIGQGVGPIGALTGIVNVLGALFSGDLVFDPDASSSAALFGGDGIGDLFSSLLGGDVFSQLGDVFDLGGIF